MLILWLGQGLTFFFDEWQYLAYRDFSAVQLLWPHNEHWVTLHVALYMGLAAVFGTGSYLPWLVALAALHVVIAAGLYRLLEQVRPGWFAVAGTIVFLFLGTGADNLLWGFQIGFDMAIAFGVWALVVVRERPVLAAWLLLGAVMSQGPGLVFVVACAALSPRAIRWLWVPVVAYGTWLVTWGATNVEPLRLDAPITAVQGIMHAAGSIVGNPAVGFVLVLAVAAAILRNRDPLVRVAVFGLLAEFGLIGLSRADYTGARYVYLAAPFLLLAASAVRLPRWNVAVGVPAFVLILVTNVGWLSTTRDYLGRLQDAETFVPLELRGTGAEMDALMAHYAMMYRK